MQIQMGGGIAVGRRGAGASRNLCVLAAAVRVCTVHRKAAARRQTRTHIHITHTQQSTGELAHTGDISKLCA
jgi:hypothetical protein